MSVIQPIPAKSMEMITYENIETCGEEVRSTNMVFLPDPNVRYFDLDRLAQYAILPSQKLMETIHQLFTLLLSLQKEESAQVEWKVSE